MKTCISNMGPVVEKMVLIFGKCVNIKLYNNQFLCVILVNLLSIGYGGMLGWMSPYLPVYLSDESPLKSGKISVDELSWIGSGICFGCLIGNFLGGYMIKHYGRKLGVLLLAVPYITSLLLVIFATNVYYLCASQVFVGICGGGLFVSVPVFVAEIAEPKIRGLLSSILIVFNNFGLLSVFLMGIYLSSSTTCEILLILPVLFIISLIFIPETPQYLLKANKLNEATKSLAFYRNCTDYERNELFLKELGLLKLNAIDADKDEDQTNLKDLCEPLALKALVIGFVLSLMNSFSGSIPLITLTSIFFTKSGSNFDPNTSALIVAIARFLSAFISAQLIDIIGRKKLLILSLCGMIIGLLAVGIFSYLYVRGFNLESYQFVPVCGITFAVFSSGLAVAGMPMVMMAEIFPKKMLSIGVSISISSFSIASFIVMKIVPMLIFESEVYGCMLLFIPFCVFALLFVIFVIPETKGKNLEEN